MRPAAAEWDEREETPWPVIQEAAKIGLYGFEAIAQFWADPTGLTLPIVNEELFWGDAGIGMSIMGTTLAVAGDLRRRARPSSSASGCRSATARRTSPRSARSACPSPTPARTCRRCARAPATTRPRTSGCSTARRPGRPTAASPTSTWSSPPSTPSSAPAARRRSSIPPDTQGLEMGTKVKKHGLRASHTADVFLDDCRVPGSLPARRQGEARRAPRPRPRGHAARKQPGGDADVRGHAPDRRRAGDRHRPRRLRVRARLRQGARAVRRARSSRTRRSRSRSPT